MGSVRQNNSLGYPIGGKEAGAKLVFGLNESGQPVPIFDARRGRACNLTCPQCGLPLVARKGEIKIHHFAHASGSICADEAGALETQAHRFAKEVLAGSSLLLPSFRYLGETGDTVEVRSVAIEETRGKIRPDVVCDIDWRDGSQNGEPHLLELAIEIKVTHRVTEQKAREFEAQRLRCIEIDIARYRYRSDEDIRRAIITEAPRRWIWKKPPMPIARPQWPSGPVPRRGSFKRPPPFPSEFTAEDWAAFNRRHP